MKSFRRILCTAFLLLAFCAASALTGAAAMPGDIDGDGQITPADARIVLRISVGLEKIEDYFPDWQNGTDPSTPGADGPGTDQPAPQEIPEDLEFRIAFDITDGGYFVGGASKAAISVTPTADLAAAKLAVVDAAEEAVFTETLKNLKKDQPATVEWDGRSGDTYALSGDYTVVVSAGEKENKLEGLNFTQKNYFSEGNGSEAHPFTVASKEDFANVVRFPKAHFIQTKDIDYALEANTSMFTADAPFNGVYDGNNKYFYNLLTSNPLFNYVGEEGKIKNINIKESGFTCQAALVQSNSGQINNCNIDVDLAFREYGPFSVGIVCNDNEGQIINCNTSGIVQVYQEKTSSYDNSIAGGIAGQNSGKILSCTSKANISVTAGFGTGTLFGGGIVGENILSGFIQSCEAAGEISANRPGGIASINNGQIKNCVYTGASSVNLVNSGSGIVA